MNRKIFMMALAASLLAGPAAKAQSIEKNVEKLAKDPKTAENAAKADVYILGHRIHNNGAPQQKETTAAKVKKKNRKCKKHTSQ